MDLKVNMNCQGHTAVSLGCALQVPPVYIIHTVYINTVWGHFSFPSPWPQHFGKAHACLQSRAYCCQDISPTVVKLQNELVLSQEATESVTTPERERELQGTGWGKEQSSNLSDIQGTLKKE